VPPSLYVRSANGAALEAVNPNDGSVRWQEGIDQVQGWVTAVSVAQNIVYVVTSEGTVSALNASDGRLRWCVSLDPATPPTNNPLWSHLAVDQQTIYAAGNSGTSLVALNASDGSQRWRGQPTNRDVTALLAAQGRAYVAPGVSSCGAVSALNASDGHQTWCFQTTFGLMAPPAMSDGAVYLTEAGPPDSAGFLDALNASDGSSRWRVQESQGGTGGLQPAVADGVVYVADTWGVAAFSASSGAKRWQVQQPAAEAGPAAANGMVYVGALTDTGAPTIAALSAGTGQQQWQMPLNEGQQFASIALQQCPTSSSTAGPVFNALSVVNSVVVVSYLSTTPTTHPVIVTLNASTGQRGWSAEGVLLAAG
jgi:outer membrane protein assembly factor BamB